MKFRNYKSAIHNFAHSFQSIDYLKSSRLAVNVLIDLNNNQIDPSATFDFLKGTIEPKESVSKRSMELLKDYMTWLPMHFKAHNCDIEKLETLQVTIFGDFEKAFMPNNMNGTIQFDVKTKTVWKADGKTEEEINITTTEVIKSDFLVSGIPEAK